MLCLFVICLGLPVPSECDSVHMCSIWVSVCKVVLLCLIVTCLIMCVQLLAMMWLVDICVSLLAFNGTGITIFCNNSQLLQFWKEKRT